MSGDIQGICIKCGVNPQAEHSKRGQELLRRRYGRICAQCLLDQIYAIDPETGGETNATASLTRRN